MGAIFISYRREDSEGHAGRLYEDLAERFGKEAVFFDVSAIEPGQDFRRAIDANVARCGVLLAVIGSRWLDAGGAASRRIDDPSDFVRLEIASALKRSIPVVPVLVQGAKMPAAGQLPSDLADLAWRNAVELSHARWASDVEVLAKSLAKHVDGGGDGSVPARGGGSRRTALIVSVAAVVAAGAGAAVFLNRPGPTPPAPAKPVDAGERARIAGLVAQMNDDDIAQRRAATARLIGEYRASAVAVELAVDQLAEASFQRLGKEGRVNVLTYLMDSDPAVWTPDQRSEAKAAVTRIQGRLASGQATLGPQVVDLLRRLDERLSGGKPAA
ncbi:MAG: toll/interleukin-1 receptor domain-containing protein [Piscinibacter sp.]